MQDGAVLAGVQVAPPTLRLMVVQFAGRPALRARPDWAGLHASDECVLLWVSIASLRRPRSTGFRCPGCAGKALDLPCLLDGYRPNRVHAAQAGGGMHKGGVAPLVGGAARFWRRGGNPPAPAFPRRGKRERGRPNSLLPQAIACASRLSPCLPRPSASPYSHSEAGIPERVHNRVQRDARRGHVV